MGHEVLVANARELASITRSSRKNDVADAEQLARLARSDPKLLRPIRHRGEVVQRDRTLLAVRRKLVDTRASLVVHARGLAKALGTPPTGREAGGLRAPCAALGGSVPRTGRPGRSRRHPQRPDRRLGRGDRPTLPRALSRDRAPTPGPRRRTDHLTDLRPHPGGSRALPHQSARRELSRTPPEAARLRGATEPALHQQRGRSRAPAPPHPIRSLDPGARPRLPISNAPDRGGSPAAAPRPARRPLSPSPESSRSFSTTSGTPAASTNPFTTPTTTPPDPHGETRHPSPTRSDTALSGGLRRMAWLPEVACEIPKQPPRDSTPPCTRECEWKPGGSLSKPNPKRP